MQFQKGKGFNGSSRNRNKSIDRETRRRIYTGKKSKKQFCKEEGTRKKLKDVKDSRVAGNGKLVVFKRNDPFAPCLLQHVLVGGKYIDHVWVKFSIEERRKLKLCKRGDRIHFTAEIHKYKKRRDREIEVKYGLSNIELIKEA